MITHPGVYTMSLDDYHAEPTDGLSISSGELRTILLESPAHYWAYSRHNPKRAAFKTPAMDFGRAVHAWVLGEPEFNRHFVVSPYDDFRTKEARAWRDGETRTVLKPDQIDTIREMAAALLANHVTRHAFTDGEPERCAFALDEQRGLWLKAAPDWLPHDMRARLVCEYKTCATIEPRKLSAQAFALGYDMQAALMVDVLHAATGEKPYGIAHVVQEKEPPYACGLMMFAPEQIQIGRDRYRRALDIFRRCWDRHLAGAPQWEAWPGYSTEPQYFQTPFYLKDNDNGPRRNYASADASSLDAVDFLAAG